MSIKVRVFPHNDLLNLAHYQLEIINTKVENKEEDALALDCLACLISLAFSVESLFNFVGYKRLKKWEEDKVERKSYKEKFKIVCVPAGFSVEEEPFITLWELKELRDSVAHSKSYIREAEAKSTEEIKKEMECSWDAKLTPEYVNHMYAVVKQFKKDLLEGAKIPLAESITSAFGTLTKT